MKKSLRMITVTALASLLGACATTKSVDEKIAASQAQSNQKIESVASQVEDLQQKQKQTDMRLDQLSQSAKEALDRAQQAGVLAKGKVVFEQSFSEDRVKFKLDSYDLDADAEVALDEFANRVKALDTQYYIEIQGHTDDSGGERYNEELGQRRADAVRRYLSRQHQIASGSHVDHLVWRHPPAGVQQEPRRPRGQPPRGHRRPRVGPLVQRSAPKAGARSAGFSCPCPVSVSKQSQQEWEGNSLKPKSHSLGTSQWISQGERSPRGRLSE